jgi:hypothetical protein
MNDLDNVRLKEVSELTDDDKKVLNTDWDKLTEEEHDYFGTVHAKENKEEDNFIPKFKTQEDFDTYLSEKVESTIEERNKKRAEDRKAKESGESRFLPVGYKAIDWDEPFQQVVPKIVDRVVEKIEKSSADRRAQLEKVNKEFDAELDAIAEKDKNVPAKGTKEREDWEADIAQTGQKYHVHSMTDAYNIWMLDRRANPQSSVATSLPREGTPVNPVASVDKISRGYGAGTAGKRTVYKVGGGRKLDETLEARMREEGIAID